MAFPARATVFLDENLPMHRGGKRADGPTAKPQKPSAKPLQERKALQDVSNTAKLQVPNICKGGIVLKERSALRSHGAMKPSSEPLQERKALKDVSNTAMLQVPNISKGTALKERSAPRNHEATKKKTLIFADEETTKSHEWAKDGVEGTHFTGNDAQKLDKDKQDKRVKKKVEKIMSALHSWSDVVFDPVFFPAKEVAAFFEEVKELELEPEILPDFNGCLSSSGDKSKLAEDSLTDDEDDQFLLLENRPVEFLIRDEEPFQALGVN